MSYAQAVKFSRNHRKDRFYQPILHGGDAGKSQRNCTHSFVTIPEPNGSYQLCLHCTFVVRERKNDHKDNPPNEHAPLFPP